MSVCIFVQIVESPALVAMLTMLSRGLNDKVEVVTRTSCLIVDNICKIVEYLAVVIRIMPELEPLVKPTREKLSNLEARNTVERDLTPQHPCQPLWGGRELP